MPLDPKFSNTPWLNHTQHLRQGCSRSAADDLLAEHLQRLARQPQAGAQVACSGLEGLSEVASLAASGAAGGVSEDTKK
jgi:hypothetical protein